MYDNKEKLIVEEHLNKQAKDGEVSNRDLWYL